MAALTLANLRSDVRSLVLEPSAHMFSDAELATWLNFGIRDFSSKVLWYSRIVAKPVTQGIFEYDLPSDIMKMEMIRFQEKYRAKVLDEAEFASMTYRQTDQSQTYPDFGFMYPHDKRLTIWPKPSTSRPAAQLNGGIDSSQTTIITMNLAGGVFPEFGYIIIEGEQIRYQILESDGLTLTNCRRGDGDTTAAAHAHGTVVELAELQLFTRALPPDLSAAGDIPKLPNEYVESIVLYCGYRAYLKRQLYDKAAALHELYLQKRKEAAEEREQASLDMASGVKDEEYGQGYGGEAY